MQMQYKTFHKDKSETPFSWESFVLAYQVVLSIFIRMIIKKTTNKERIVPQMVLAPSEKEKCDVRTLDQAIKCTSANLNYYTLVLGSRVPGRVLRSC